MKSAIFPGSFDPFHDGHDFVVQKGLKDFDLIYIVISWNENKKRFISYLKSKKIIRKKYKNNKKIKILINKKQLTVNIARKLNCFNIIRGYRNNDDLKYEQWLKSQYLLLEPQINFILYKSNIDLNSTVIKIWYNKGN